MAHRGLAQTLYKRVPPPLSMFRPTPLTKFSSSKLIQNQSLALHFLLRKKLYISSMSELSATIKPIHPTNDVRVTHEFATVNGRRYHYVNGLPAGPQKGVAVLLHGFPDLWYGWRYQIPFLLDQGLRVITPDLIGYGQTDKPVCTDEDIHKYSMKSIASDISELVKQLGIPKVIAIGHDWGSIAAQRFAFYYPDLVSHIALISVPFEFGGPLTKYMSLEELVETFPNFRYQISFQDPAKTENRLKTREDISKFIRGAYRPVNPKVKAAQDAGELIQHKGINNGDSVIDILGDQPRSKLLTEEDLEYYVDQFYAGGFHGPCNWYRTRRVNYENEKGVHAKLQIPALFIESTYDSVFPPSWLAGQERFVAALTYRMVPTGHFSQVESPDGVNAHLKEWLDNVVFGNAAKL